MKKTYKNPTLTVVKLQPARILAGSEKIGVGSNYNGSATIESRRGRFSDWEEEEE